MSTQAVDALNTQLDALRARIERELPRNAGDAPPSTEAVGGWSKLGARLDGTLRALFEVVCAARHAAPAAAWEHEFRSPWDKVTAGMIARALCTSWAQADVAHEGAAVLLADLRAKDSALATLIALRNAFVHERATPMAAEVSQALRRALALIDRASSR